MPVAMEHKPAPTPTPLPLVLKICGLERVTRYVALPTCWGIAGPLDDPPVDTVTDPLPVPWTSQFSPAAGAAIVLAAKPRPSASTSRRARIGFAQRDVISVLLFR